MRFQRSEKEEARVMKFIEEKEKKVRETGGDKGMKNERANL